MGCLGISWFRENDFVLKLVQGFTSSNFEVSWCSSPLRIISLTMKTLKTFVRTELSTSQQPRAPIGHLVSQLVH